MLGSTPGLLRAYLALRKSLTTRRPDLAILVDSPDLNLRFAAVAKRLGIPVFYYVAPQVWAWRPGRVRQLRRRTDRMAVIFPFEEALLRRAGIDATFVGHPLADSMARVREQLQPKQIATELGLDLERPILALLPGSRRNELRGNLPCMLETAALLREAIPSSRSSYRSLQRWFASRRGSPIPCSSSSGAPTRRSPSRPVRSPLRAPSRWRQRFLVFLSS